MWLHGFELVQQVVPLVGGQAQPVHQWVDGLPAHADDHGPHAARCVLPACADAREDAQGGLVFGPHLQLFGVVVFQLEACLVRLRLGDGRLVQRTGNGRQFPSWP